MFSSRFAKRNACASSCGGKRKRHRQRKSQSSRRSMVIRMRRPLLPVGASTGEFLEAAGVRSARVPPSSCPQVARRAFSFAA